MMNGDIVVRNIIQSQISMMTLLQQRKDIVQATGVTIDRQESEGLIWIA
jgi:hypothetical protein